MKNKEELNEMKNTLLLFMEAEEITECVITAKHNYDLITMHLSLEPKKLTLSNLHDIIINCIKFANQ